MTLQSGNEDPCTLQLPCGAPRNTVHAPGIPWRMEQRPAGPPPAEHSLGKAPGGRATEQ